MWNLLAKYCPIVKSLNNEIDLKSAHIRSYIKKLGERESELHSLKTEVKRYKDFQMMYNQKVEENKEQLSKLHWYEVQMKLMDVMVEENKVLKAHIIQLKIDNQSLNEILSHKTV